MDYKDKVIALLNSQELSKEQKEKLEGIFPELKESEDEKMRKELIIFLEELSKLGKNTNFDKWKTSDCANWIAWLEKQGKQKPTDETPYPETLEKAIDLYYYSYGNGKGEFEHLSLEKFRDIVHTFVSDYGQKPAWSEEDERLRRKLIELIYSVSYCDERENLSNWLKSLKPQPKQVWSEEDEENLSFIICHLCINLVDDAYIKYKEWLKSLKQRIGG